VSPHPDDFYGVRVIQDLVHEPMLDVDAAGAGTGEVSNQLLERRRALPGVRSEESNQLFCLIAEAGARDLSSVLLCLAREDHAPVADGLYQPGLSEVLERGVFRPLRIDSLIPGTERR
jgi:hypothetical protein